MISLERDDITIGRHRLLLLSLTLSLCKYCEPQECALIAHLVTVVGGREHCYDTATMLNLEQALINLRQTPGGYFITFILHFVTSHY